MCVIGSVLYFFEMWLYRIIYITCSVLHFWNCIVVQQINFVGVYITCFFAC